MYYCIFDLIGFIYKQVILLQIYKKTFVLQIFFIKVLKYNVFLWNY